MTSKKTNEGIHDIIYNVLNCILIEENIRDGFFSDNFVELKHFIHLFPNLYVNQIDVLNNGGNWTFITKQKLTKHKIKMLNHKNPKYDESIGKLLGYPCYKDYKILNTDYSIDTEYSIDLMVEYKYKNKLFHKQMFGNRCLKKDNISVFDNYADKSNKSIPKYKLLLDKFNIKNVKFYSTISTPNDLFFIHLIELLINMMLVDSGIIKGFILIGTVLLGSYRKLISKFFSNIHLSLQYSSSMNDDIILCSSELYKDHSLNEDEYDKFTKYKNENTNKHTAFLVVYVNINNVNNLIQLDIESQCKSTSKTKFKELLHDATSMINKYNNVTESLDFKINKFDILFN